MRETMIVRKEEKMMNGKWYTANDVLNAKSERGVWLVDNYLPLHEISGITGPSDTGKSTLLRQLVLSIVSDKNDFLGMKLNCKHRQAIYISTEDGLMGVQEGIHRQVENMKIDKDALDRLHFLFDEENIFDELNARLRQNPVDLIAVDCFSDTYRGNPNDMVMVREYMRRLKDIIGKYECSVIILHHNVKNSEKGAPDKNKLNGSQALEAKMRSLLELRLGDNDNERLLTILKANYIPQELKKKSKVLVFDGDSRIFSMSEREATDNKGVVIKYDKALWLERVQEYCQGLSLIKTVSKLEAMFPEEEIPGKTWFSDNLKGRPSGLYDFTRV